MLRDPAAEHTLLINEVGEYELVPYVKIAAPAQITVFQFSRKDENWAVYWHRTGEGKLWLPIKPESMQCYNSLAAQPLPLTACDSGTVLPVSGRRYIKTNLSADALKTAFARAKLLQEEP